MQSTTNPLSDYNANDYIDYLSESVNKSKKVSQRYKNYNNES